MMLDKKQPPNLSGLFPQAFVSHAKALLHAEFRSFSHVSYFRMEENYLEHDPHMARCRSARDQVTWAHLNFLVGRWVHSIHILEAKINHLVKCKAQGVRRFCTYGSHRKSGGTFQLLLMCKTTPKFRSPNQPLIHSSFYWSDTWGRLTWAILPWILLWL